jgi:hypothetical protein
MTFDEFKRASQRLEDCYGRTLSQPQAQIWFDELKYYTLEKYEKAIRNLCTSYQYFPTLSVMLNAIKNVKADVNLAPSEPVPCEACRGSGYLFYKKVIDGIPYDYVCLCSCQNAIGKEYDGTKIADKEHRSNYYIAKAEDVFYKQNLVKPEAKAIDFDVEQINF